MIFARLVPIPRGSGIDPSCQENMLVSQIVTAIYGDTVCTLKDTSYVIGEVKEHRKEKGREEETREG
ncbi:hypothetical protein INT47_003712 [Mucor saturninus]|uniref:Uncharacterized protein n=1 Tax=Mucor saturninus TaxID=64648 RepID=A0A8H7RA89_9FUNG|nr:hypothetical protein INT47_003712 [Mucor saturninus]